MPKEQEAGFPASELCPKHGLSPRERAERMTGPKRIRAARMRVCEITELPVRTRRCHTHVTLGG